MHDICRDLELEHADLDGVVAAMSEREWSAATPSVGWSIRDQISHLWFFDVRALMALTDPQEFERDKQQLLAGGGTDASVVPGRSMSGDELLALWREDRALLLEAARVVDPSARVPWYGPSMAARSFITARLMETWAHGQDVVDALGASRPASERLRHVAHIGVRARPFSYAVNGMTLPEADVRVVLQAPDGAEWSWGASASDTVQGTALDFCLVVTQRRHLADTDLSVVGEVATEWISIAQAFAGPPGGGRSAGEFPRH
ncbi:MAG: TIGR03084 family metal-binding protein [Actinomycetota bacterium]